MITLDEVIEQERKQVEMYRCEYECECDYYDKCFVDDHADRFECIKNMHEHEQLVEWLEELKALRTTSYGYSKEDIEVDQNSMYNKAIDDFVKIAKEHDFKYGTNDITNCVIGFIEFLAKQLKE